MINRNSLYTFICYSCSWMSLRSLKEAIPMFLLLFNGMILFVEWSYNSIACANLPIYLALSFSTATIYLDKNPLCTAWCHPRQELPLWLLMACYPHCQPPFLHQSHQLLLIWKKGCHWEQQPYHSSHAGNKIFNFQRLLGQELHHHKLSSLLVVVVLTKKSCIFCIHTYFGCLVPDVHNGNMTPPASS